MYLLLKVGMTICDLDEIFIPDTGWEMISFTLIGGKIHDGHYPIRRKVSIIKDLIQFCKEL